MENYIIENIEITKNEIFRLNQILNNITDCVLIDQFIFELKANEEKCRYWYRLAKLENISSDRYLFAEETNV